MENMANQKNLVYTRYASEAADSVKSGEYQCSFLLNATKVHEIKDVSLFFKDTKILQATFSAACIVDYMKNRHTSEIAYNGKTVDIVHVSALGYEVSTISDGTFIKIDLEKKKVSLSMKDVQN